MSTPTLKEEFARHSKRLIDPSRPCDNCYQPFEGQGHPVTFFLSTGRLIFSVCDTCHVDGAEVVAKTARFISGFYVSDDAAALLEAVAGNPGKELSDEIVKMQEWLTKYNAPGASCDECGSHLLDGDPTSTAAVAMTGGMSGYHVLHVVCPRCAKTETPRLRSKCDRFLTRLVSTRASAFISDLIEPKKVVN